LTAGAHGKTRHGGQRPVVRSLFDDGEPRPAVGAVYERIEKTPVVLIKHLGQTVGAQGYVRRDPGDAVAVLALPDGKVPAFCRLCRGSDQFIDQGLGRQFAFYVGQELIEAVRPALGMDLHPPAGIQHPAGQVVFFCQAVDEGPEAHSLDDAVYVYLYRGHNNFQINRPVFSGRLETSFYYIPKRFKFQGISGVLHFWLK
jgi:hypothetical protein